MKALAFLGAHYNSRIILPAHVGALVLFCIFFTSCALQSENKNLQTLQDPLPENKLGPKLVLIPSGEFVMGSPRSEVGRYEDEGPQHTVRIKQAFFMAETPVTVAQFRTFIEATGYRTIAEKEQWSEWRNPETGIWEAAKNLNWRHNQRGEINGDDYPAVYVAWDDAKAYTEWLSKITKRKYRLPSEAEMEYANRAGTITPYWWGNSTPKQKVANLKGEHDIPENDKTWFPTPEERQYAYAHGYTPFLFEGYGDGYWGLSPVASFKPNPFGLFDTAGNVWEWTEDCWNGSHHGAPADGSPRLTGACTRRVVRGGSYYCFPRHVRSANRWSQLQINRTMYVGFRVVREVDLESEDF
ncbi:formylglycine-generating enzyme family protein [Kaarinaea lacus]